jgi:acetoin utilization deacetylase AcuC-like enzyme
MNIQQKTGFVWMELYMWHFQGIVTGHEPSGIQFNKGIYLQPSQHFENAETKRRIFNLLSVSGLIKHLLPLEARMATEEELEWYHTKEYIKKIKLMSENGGGDAGDYALLNTGGYEIARYAVGGCIIAVDAVWKGKVRNAYALVRPPGHHAENNQGMGFCIFNNIVIAAMYALKMLGTKKIAIIDFDVHHGNGTQKAFYENPNVLFISVHQDSLYPINSGKIEEIGKGEGLGFNYNIPLPPGTGFGGYQAVFDRIIIPAIEKFKPELIMVSCGFDASAFDPLSRMMLSSESFREFTKKIMAVADKVCNGKIVMCHEGGYSVELVPFCGLAVIEELSGKKMNIIDPFVEEIHSYGYQTLQKHQEEIILKVEKLLHQYLLKF